MMFELAGILAKELSINPARVATVQDDGIVLIEFGGVTCPAQFLRTSQAPPPVLSVGDKVLVAFDIEEEAGLILGLIEAYRVTDEEEVQLLDNGKNIQVVGTGRAEVVRVKGRKIHLEAGDEIQITCGEGKISIDRSGKIVVRGNNVLSRAKQTNKIKGGSVAIN